MKKFITFLFIAIQIPVFSQQPEEIPVIPNLIDLGAVSDNNTNFQNYGPLKEVLKDAEIVMLGEQSHGDGTTFETKIKLIKYLHQEMGFDMLAFESDLYDCTKAWENIEKGGNVADALGNSIFYLWSTTKEFKPLAQYIDANKNSETPLVINGFDDQFNGRFSKNDLADDLTTYIAMSNPELIETPEWNDFRQSMVKMVNYDVKKYKKKQARADTTFINTLINSINPTDSAAQFWTQVLRNAKYSISDIVLKTDNRDRQMAENLIWLKESNPGKKIICWGATSHFLYNCSEVKLMKFPYNIVDNYYQKQPMMGQYAKDKYGDKLYTIGFISYQGDYGLLRHTDLKPAPENSLEYAIEKSGYDNCFLSFKNFDSGDLISRPLGQKYMKSNISHVMDGVIFNKNMKGSHLDRNFFLKMYPENRWIKPEPVAETSD